MDLASFLLGFMIGATVGSIIVLVFLFSTKNNKSNDQIEKASNPKAHYIGRE